MKAKGLSFKGIIVVFLLSFAVLFNFTMPVFAVSGTSIVDDDASRDALNSAVQDAVSDNKYQTSAGGYITGSNIVKNGLVDEDRFGQLTTSAKQKILSDMNNAVDKKIANDKSEIENSDTDGASNAVSDETKSNWITELQQTDGVGSQLLSTILSQTKPDFVKANKIYKPFSGPISTALGLGAILIMAGVSITMVSDIAWIVVPLFRGLANVDEGREKSGFHLISYSAISAVQEAESGGDGGKGANKIAVFLYLKKMIAGLTVLGICLLYLVAGHIFIFVGYIMDLVSGFLGF